MAWQLQHHLICAAACELKVVCPWIGQLRLDEVYCFIVHGYILIIIQACFLFTHGSCSLPLGEMQKLASPAHMKILAVSRLAREVWKEVGLNWQTLTILTVVWTKGTGFIQSCHETQQHACFEEGHNSTACLGRCKKSTGSS